MHGLLISAAHKSSGKTTLSIGLCAALAARGSAVQPFKKGPDYIDPNWLALASGRPCYNLDPYLMQPAQLQALFASRARHASLCLVEGNKGLYDGLSLDGSNSNAALAHALGLPVVLVIDARGMTRGIAPLLLGYQAFDPGLDIAGVILNRLGGSRHEAKLRAVIEHYTTLKVIGAVAEQPELALAERHLGLMPGNEHAQACLQVHRMGQRIAGQVDLEALLAIGARARTPAQPQGAAPRPRVPEVRAPLAATTTPVAADAPAPARAPVRIGYARDAAFGFYYPDDLEALQAAGAELLPFDTLRDEALPAALDGLLLGGGFPEQFLQPLAANTALRTAIAGAIAQGLPTYAECGGLMYLAESITWNGATHPMVGAIPGRVTMHARPVGRGYVHLQATPDMPWPGLQGQAVRGHEFHYSSLDGLPADARFAWRVQRGHGIDGRHDGLVQGNLLASYSHLRSLAGADWAAHFVASVRHHADALAHPPGSAPGSAPGAAAWRAAHAPAPLGAPAGAARG